MYPFMGKDYLFWSLTYFRVFTHLYFLAWYIIAWYHRSVCRLHFLLKNTIVIKHCAIFQFIYHIFYESHSSLLKHVWKSLSVKNEFSNAFSSFIFVTIPDFASVLTRSFSAKWRRMSFQSARRLNKAMRRHRWVRPTRQMEIQTSHLAKYEHVSTLVWLENSSIYPNYILSRSPFLCNLYITQKSPVFSIHAVYKIQ